MSEELDFHRFRRQLRDREAELLQQKDDSADQRQPVELDQTSVGRVSRVEALQSQAVAIATDRNRDLELNRIAAALQRLDDGTYGSCVSCDQEIAVRRLEADPSTPLCIDCASGRGSRDG